MSMELCGDCLKLFDADTSIETPKGFLIPPLYDELNSCIDPSPPIAADILFVWRCPVCSIEDKVSA